MDKNRVKQSQKLYTPLQGSNHRLQKETSCPCSMRRDSKHTCPPHGICSPQNRPDHQRKKEENTRQPAHVLREMLEHRGTHWQRQRLVPSISLAPSVERGGAAGSGRPNVQWNGLCTQYRLPFINLSWPLPCILSFCQAPSYSLSSSLYTPVPERIITFGASSPSGTSASAFISYSPSVTRVDGKSNCTTQLHNSATHVYPASFPTYWGAESKERKKKD